MANTMHNPGELLMLNLFNLFIFIPVISIASMIWGWGIEPKSWPVIIGMYYLLVFISFVCTLVDDNA